MAQLIPTGQISLLIIMWITATSAQSQSLRGTVTDDSGEPLAGATVILKNTTRGTATDLNGQYFLNQLPVGQHTLVISYLGYQTRQQSVTLSSEEAKEVLVQLTEAAGALEDVFVTATRTARAIGEVPVPAQVITGEQIDRIGSLRLDEVLQEQTGLQMISDHGSGLQMQGLSSDYILILIDGEPVIGRTAGTTDLTRLTVNNIERIEIIRGPSSSLYGSEAMAGVVNIITRGNDPGWNGNLGTQFRSFGTWDARAEAGYRNDRLSVRMFANRLRSNGYDLNSETVSQTVAPFEALTFGPKVSYRINNKLKLRVSSRFYQESSEDQLDITLEETPTRMNSKNIRSDWNVLPILEYRPNDHHHLQVRHYMSGYQTESNLTYQTDGQIYDLSTFDQTFQRSEAQYDWYYSDRHIITGGAGHLTERVEATRYDDVNRFNSTYVFAQYQWQPTDRWNVVAGGRYDAHSAYANRLSPKLAVGYQASDWFSVQASFGGGYKAPDFRQLLLNFTNPVAGYSVLGSRIVQEEFVKFQERGEIEQVLIDTATVEEIRAESSLAYNLGFRKKPSDKIQWQTNFFRNDIQDLIETAPIARKTNGQNIFSYFNFAEVLTQGVETQVDYEPYPGWAFSVGYQYLDTRDKEAYQRVEDGEIFRRDENNRTVAVTTSDYGGLFNRSRHSGNAKLFYTNSKYNFDVALRGIYRGRWGLGDFNGNTVLDGDNEYADGYWQVNLSARKHFGAWLTLEAGANNLTDQTTPNEPALAGRIFFAGLQLNFVKSNP
ncbi:MAG: TonB-dependent receptor domain-containing protein [Cyclobacteriaceae bacterium]